VKNRPTLIFNNKKRRNNTMSPAVKLLMRLTKDQLVYKATIDYSIKRSKINNMRKQTLAELIASIEETKAILAWDAIANGSK